MHVKILIECSFTSKELSRIACKWCCKIAHKQVKISELIYKFEKIDRIAYEQIKVNKLICKFEEIDKITYKQIKINELNVNLTKLTKLLVNK